MCSSKLLIYICTLVLAVCTLSLPAVQSQGMNPPPRFSSLSQCLETGTLNCVSCPTRVTVNTAEGRDCEPGRNLTNQVCNSLYDVLRSIANVHTTYSPSMNSCIEIQVHPVIGLNGTVSAHVLDEMVYDEGVDIRQNVVLRGVTGTNNDISQAPVRVYFPRFNVSMLSDTAIYPVRFTGSQLVGFDGLIFEGGSGIIGMDMVQVVAIENCEFSNFPQGALDIYNCPSVFIRCCTFANNGLLSVTKGEPYRGHAAGASIAFDVPPDQNGPLVEVIGCTFVNNTSERTTADTTFTTTTSSPDINSTGNNNNNNNDDENNNNNNDDDNNNNDDNRNRRNRRPMTEAERFEARGSVLQERNFPGRGGGLAVIVNSQEEANISIRRCTFEGNYALEFGGGLYSYLEGKSAHTIIIRRSRFLTNISPSTGGGLHMSFAEEAKPGSLNQVLVHDTEFIGNYAQFGGGAYFLPYIFDQTTYQDHSVGVFASFNNCTFHNNIAQEVGGAFGVTSTAVAAGSENTKPLEIINCTFTENSVNGAGIVSVAKFPVSFLGSTVFTSNRGPSLAIIGSLVRANGVLTFRNNSNIRSLDGGAVYITSLGQLQISPNSQIDFLRNEGSNGAALVVQRPAIPETFSQLFFNPLCPLLFSEPTLLPDSWTDYNVSMRFADNEAFVAAAVYANEIDICSWTNLSPPYFNKRRAFHWNFVSFSNNLNKAHTQGRRPKWAVQTPAVMLNLRQNELQGFPGERLSMRVFAYDELNETTAATVRIIDETITSSTGSITRDLFRFQPSSVTLDNVTNGAQLDLRFQRQMSVSPLNSEDITMETVLGITRKNFAMDKFALRSRRCPPGTKLLGMSMFVDCVCDTGRSDIVTCDGRMITLADNLWGSVYNSGIPVQNDDPLQTFNCPSGYCTCVLQNTTGSLQCNHIFNGAFQDDQCHCNRQGVLCGSCKDGLGFSTLLDRCVSCGEEYGGFILALFVLDLIVMVTLLVAMLPVPLWLYPVLFYLQLLPHFTEHFPVTFEKVRPFLYYVGSALGLYFPYDFCLNSQLGPLLSYTIRYLPLLSALIITPVVVTMRYKMCRPCPWHGVWWLVLLLYTSVLHTSMSILNCPIFRAADGSNVPRWYINGNIRCFNGSHIPLGLLAIVVLTVCGALIPLFVLISLDKLTRPRWLHYLSVALTDAYKPKYKWWSGVELAKRFLLVLFSVSFKNDNYPVIFILIVLMGVFGYMKPYKSRAVNILDVMLASDTLILLLLRNTVFLQEQLHYIPEQPRNNFTLTPTRNTTFSDSTCLEITGLSPFVILLTPFYYLPLFIATLLFLSWMGYNSYLWLKDCHRVYKDTRDINLETSITSPFDLSRMRARTQTVVDIREYDSEDMISPKLEQSLPASLNGHMQPPSSEGSLTPIASWYLKAKRASSRRRASRKMKEKPAAGGLELQQVPKIKTKEAAKKEFEAAAERAKENITEENISSRIDGDDGTLESGGSYTLI